VVATNLSGARTSAVARLYVTLPALRTNRVVIDNFDDNRLTGWSSEGHPATILETKQQITVGGYWPGVVTWEMTDSVAPAFVRRNWNLADRQTLEWRADLANLSEHATAVAIELVNSAIDGAYALIKGRDFIKLNKPTFSTGGFAHLVHQQARIPNTNVILAFALTRVSPDLILTGRILDKANNAVLYEHSFVDTPNADRTLTTAEVEAISGMHLRADADICAIF
jgi:hypothetical protein